MFCDLHTHSVFSDGTDTPKQLVEQAVAKGLGALALTDHNTVAGLPAFLEAAQGQPIQAICGAEFSVDLEGRELHLLGLYIPVSAFSRVTALMEDFRQRKEDSNRLLVENLYGDGFQLDYGQIRAQAGGYVNRAHIANALMEKGYVTSVQEAFHKLLAPEKGYYIQPQRLSVWETLAFLKEVGAVPVLAHPFLNLDEEALSAFLPKAKEAGLVGVEVLYSAFDGPTRDRAGELVRQFGLLPSGGSDYHGTIKPDIPLGLEVPITWAQALQPQ